MCGETNSLQTRRTVRHACAAFTTRGVHALSEDMVLQGAKRRLSGRPEEKLAGPGRKASEDASQELNR